MKINLAIQIDCLNGFYVPLRLKPRFALYRWCAAHQRKDDLRFYQRDMGNLRFLVCFVNRTFLPLLFYSYAKKMR
jgi:hypothetical protein